MHDPVATVDGTTYERACIVAWFKSGGTTSPATGEPLESFEIFPNDSVRDVMGNYMTLRGQMKDDHAHMSKFFARAELMLSRKLHRMDRTIKTLRTALDDGDSSSSYAGDRSFRESDPGHSARSRSLSASRAMTASSLEDEPAASHSQPVFVAGGAPENKPLDAEQRQLMREQQRRELAGKGSWWARLCP